MVNISDVNERANCLKTGNVTVLLISQPASESAWQISNNFFAHIKQIQVLLKCDASEERSC